MSGRIGTARWRTIQGSLARPRSAGSPPENKRLVIQLPSSEDSRRAVRRVAITSVGAYLPERILSNADLERMVETSDEWIVERTGIRERRVVEKGTGCSYLASRAAEDALRRRGISAEDIDLIVVATVTPDMSFPATACLVQDEIGASRAWGFDLSAACSGFNFALSAGTQFIASGSAERALVIGADVMSSITDYEDRTTCILFGDAAGAVLLEAAQDGEGILGFNNMVDGSGRDLLRMPAGGSARPPTHETVEGKEHFLKQQGPAVFRFAVRNSAEAAEDLLAELGISTEEVAYLVCHQANARIIDGVAKRLHLPPERVVKTVHKYGNTTAASIPTALRDALDRSLLSPGDLLLFSSVGAGLTIGTAVLRWGGERLGGEPAATNSAGQRA